MNGVVSVAGSRGRTSIVVVETIRRPGLARPVKLVKEARRFRPEATPMDMREDVVRTVEVWRAQRGHDGSDPRVVVSYAVAGGALHSVLREAKAEGLLRRNPLGITTYQSVQSPGVDYASPNRLASVLYTEVTADRVEFVDGLARLRSQVAAFEPVISKVGNLAFGSEEMSDYDDLTVALMHAVIAARDADAYGIPRYRDQSGFTWPSRAMAVARAGTAAR